MAARIRFLIVLGTVVLAAAFLLRPQVASAETPFTFIERLGGDALRALENEDLTAEQRTEAFRRVLDKGFDIDAMGRFVLGRYWRTASEMEREEYLVLFRERVMRLFAARLGNFKGEAFKVIDSREQAGNLTVVGSQLLLPPLPPISVDWHVRGQDPEYRVIDVVVQGISEIQTQRNGFASAIVCSDDGLRSLLDQLQRNAAALPTCEN